MTDSGFSGLPPGPHKTGEASFLQISAALKAKIVEIRGAIKVADARQKMEGEIVHHNSDGTTRIHTEKGDITVEIRARALPPEGTRVEIEIPAESPDGAPPRQAVIRALAPPAERQAAPQQQPPDSRLPDRSGAPQPPSQPPSQSPPGRPLLDALIPETVIPAPQRQAALPLQPGDILRLLPAPMETALPPQAEILIKTSLPPIIPAAQAPLPLFQNTQIDKTDVPAHDAPSPAAPALPARSAATDSPHPLSWQPPAPAAIPAVSSPLQQFLAAPQTRALPPVSSALADTVSFLLRAPALSAPESAAKFFFSAPAEAAPTPGLTATRLSFSPVSQGLAMLAPLSFENENPAIQTTTGTIFPVQHRPFQAGPAFDIRIQAVFPPAVSFTAPGDRPLQAGIRPIKETGTEALQSPAFSKHGFTFLPSHPAGGMTGEITGIAPRGLPVVSFPVPDSATMESFTLPFPASNLPVGAQIQIMPQSPPAGALPLSPPHDIPFIPALFFSDFSWPAMDDLYKTLQQAAPQTAQALANTVVNPATPARIPAAALFFIAAIRSGDIGNWLGDKTADTLRRIGKGELINRLVRDAGGLQRASAEPAGGGAQDWRSTAFPMMGDDGLYKMMLHYRHEHGRNEEGKEERRGARFIFDLSLNRMGPVQLDGLFRIGTGRQSRLDLIVRTGVPLSAPMRETMRAAYANALSQTDLAGDIAFQNRLDQFVKVKMQEKTGSLSA